MEWTYQLVTASSSGTDSPAAGGRLGDPDGPQLEPKLRQPLQLLRRRTDPLVQQQPLHAVLRPQRLDRLTARVTEHLVVEPECFLVPVGPLHSSWVGVVDPRLIRPALDQYPAFGVSGDPVRPGQAVRRPRLVTVHIRRDP